MNYKGPVIGTLIFGRYYGKDLLDYFEESTHSSLLIYRVDRPMPADFQEKFSNGS